MNAQPHDITPATLRQLLRYDPEKGDLFWRERGPEWFAAGNTSPQAVSTVWNKRHAGKKALTYRGPCGHLLCNLRAVTADQNKANAGKRPRREPSSRFIGVELIPSTGRWGASVGANGGRTWVGSFASEEEAARARDKVALSIKGEFARLNFPEVHHV